MGLVKYWLYRSSGIALFLLLWEIGPRRGWIDPEFAPAFSTVIGATWRLCVDGTLPLNLLVSLWRGLAGLLAATLIGIPAGFAIGRWWPAMAEPVEPLLRILSQVNPFSLMPVFMLFFGIGETAKVAVVAWVCFWPVFYQTITAIRTLDPELVKSALAMGVPPFDAFRRVLLPAAAPTIFVGVRVAASLTWFMLVAAEMIGAHAGLGRLLHNAAHVNDTNRMYAAGLFIILAGVLLNRSLRRLESGIFAWRDSQSLFGSHSPRRARQWRRPALFRLVLCLAILMVAAGMAVQRVNRQGEGGGERFLRPMNHGGHGAHGAHGSKPRPITDPDLDMSGPEWTMDPDETEQRK